MRGRLHLPQPLADGVFLHGGNPEPQDGLIAARQIIDEAEDELALAPRVAGVDDLGNVGAAHEAFERFKLPGALFNDLVLPGPWDDGQVLLPPSGVAHIVTLRRGQFHQMSGAPAHQDVRPLQIAGLLLPDVQHRGNGLGNAGLFRNNQPFHEFPPLHLHKKKQPLEDCFLRLVLLFSISAQAAAAGPSFAPLLPLN